MNVKKPSFLNFPLGRKKAQVTLFIILGIIIVIGAGIYFAVRQSVTKSELAPGLELTLEEVPIEFRPVSSFVETCLTQIAQEGITKLGERGGFINLVQNGINTKQDTTNSDAVQFSPNSDYSVPYWWHLSSDNKCSGDCAFTIIPENKLYLKKKPAKTSIESQMEEYIQANLRSCLNNFQTLEQQGFTIQEKGEIMPKVVVAEDDIVVYIEYPLQVQKQATEELSKFFVRLPINIKRIYDMAFQLTNFEGEYHFIERDVLNLIVGFSAVDKEKLPPMSETKFRIGKLTTWKKSRVKENLINMLASYIQLLQVYGTRNYQPYIFPGNSLLESLYNRGMLVPGSEDYSSLEVRFNYNPFWNIYFDLNCDGETCKPESVITDFLTLIGVQNYNFIYDLSFPVEVEIYDPQAFNNRGYTFKFFLEANIRQNSPMKTSFVPLRGIFTETTMLCDDNKRNSGDITINVNDPLTKEGIDDVQIVYSSYEENCLIGSTENGTYVGKFPIMLGGVVSLLKDDYLSYSQKFDTKLNTENQLDIALQPKLTKKFIVKKRLVAKSDSYWNLDGEADLREDEEAYVTLRRQSSLEEGEFSTTAMYSGNQTEMGEIDIAPGVYELSIELIYNKPIRIPSRTIKKEDESFTIQEFNLDEGFRVGGAAINVTFTKEFLKYNEVVFYALNPDIVGVPESQRILEDLAYVSNANELSQLYKGSIMPKPR